VTVAVGERVISRRGFRAGSFPSAFEKRAVHEPDVPDLRPRVGTLCNDAAAGPYVAGSVPR
jgi:hypothetical protein